MTCDHTFIRINDVTKPRAGVQNSVSWNGLIPGASAACVYCGQVRVVYEDGEVRIVVAGGAPIDNNHVTSRP